MRLTDAFGQEVTPGFYYDGFSKKPGLNYVVVFAEDGFREYFPVRINCLSPETQANRVVPLSSNHKKYFDGEGLDAWIQKQIVRYPDAASMKQNPIIVEGSDEHHLFGFLPSHHR